MNLPSAASLMLHVAAFLSVAVGVAHSVLGERYILMRLFRREDLPKLFGGTEFTVRTLRFAWHVTSIAWWGFAGILMVLAHPPVEARRIGMVIAATFLAHFVVAFFGSRRRHLSWIVFLAIGILTFLGVRG